VTDSSIWTIQYAPAEDFSSTTGGTVDIIIPTGWTLPQITSPVSPGYVNWTDANYVNSVAVLGDTIRLLLGAPPRDPFVPGASVSVLYGAGGGHASAHPQTTSQDTVYFRVRSDPALTGSPASIQFSPSVSVAPGRVVSAKVIDGADSVVGTLTRTTDQDTTQLFLRGYDAYGNRARLIRADWTLAGGVGAPVPSNGTGTALRLDTPGTGYAIADSSTVETGSSSSPLTFTSVTATWKQPKARCTAGRTSLAAQHGRAERPPRA